MTQATTEQELSDAIATAQTPFCIQGGKTRGDLVDAQPLDVSRLSGISLYEPGALTLVAVAGTPLHEIEAQLAEENQMLPFEPMDHRALLGTNGVPTIGGCVATNASGPRRIQGGACRDFLLGVRFVDGRGQIIKNGGRVMKNVTGYDLTKVMAGSRGTLGVLTEVSLKVLPRPEASKTLILHDLDIERAVQAMSAALKSPFEVSGAAHVPEGAEGGPVTMIRLEGFSASVDYRTTKLTDLLASHSPRGIETRDDAGRSDTTTPSWQWIRDAELFAGSDEDVWRVSVKPSDAVKLAETLSGARLLLDWGGGLVWAGLPSGTDLRAQLGKIPGHATLVRASDAARLALPTFQPEPAALASLAAGLRKQFDPRGLLNPGLMG